MSNLQKELIALVEEAKDKGMKISFEDPEDVGVYHISDKIKLKSYKDKHPTLHINNIVIQLDLSELLNLIQALTLDSKAWITFSALMHRNTRKL